MELVKGYRFFSPEECAELTRYCDTKEKDLLKFHNKRRRGGYKPEDNKIPVTQRYHSLYNFFRENDQFVGRLLECLQELVPEMEYPIAVQSWVNIYRKGQGIMWHTHAGTNGYSFSANVFLGGPATPGIYYSVNPEDVFNVQNEVGSMHLFPHSLNHMVPASEFDDKRYTVGITIHGFSAIDRVLIAGSAENAEFRETLILSAAT